MSSNTTIVVLGASGLLGHHLMAELGADAHGLTHTDLDITDRDAVFAALDDARVVVNCAAWTDVDGNERDPERAHRVNGLAVHHIADAAKRAGARLVHISTDFVFDGLADVPYRPEDRPAPISVYGHAKHLGERNALAYSNAQVVRVQALYGAGGRNFASRLPELLRAGTPLTIDRQRRVQPTWVVTAARALARLVVAPVARPIVHLSARGEATWATFVRALATRLGVSPNMREVDSVDLALAALRPAMCLFADDPAARMPSWQDDLDAFVAAHGAESRP